MSRYEREEYENWDEYEDEEQDDERVGEDEYEEEEEEAPPQPTQQEMEYLEFRNELKVLYRKQMKKENGSSFGHSNEKKKLPYDNYGSFFGPSQPVIATRVLQESMSLLENERLTTKVPKPNHNNKSSASTSSKGGSQNNVHVSRPKNVNQLKNKVEKVKDARDYSFLLSDDAELPAARKDPPRNVSGGPTSDARSGQGPPKNKPILNSNGRQASNGSRQVSNGTRQVQNGSRQASNGNRQVLNGSRQVHSESRQASNGNRQVLNGSRQASVGNRQLPNGREERRNVSSAANVNLRAAPQKLNSANKPISKQADSRKQLVSNNGSGPGRPVAAKPLPNKVPSGTLQNKVPFSGAKPSNSERSMPKPASAIKQPMVSKQSSSIKQPLDQRKGYQDLSKGKILSKQPVPPSRHQMSKPSTKVPSRSTFEKDRPKKRPANDRGGSSGVTSMIQKLMGYNPNKYEGIDSDDSDMEANFHQIMREEIESERHANAEDEEEARKLKEEERREKLRRQAKKRKLSR